MSGLHAPPANPPYCRRGFTFDNRWVVPYNPYLSLRYDAHINVEVCSSASAVKYLYKYVYKGHDRAGSHGGREIACSPCNRTPPPPKKIWGGGKGGVAPRTPLYSIYGVIHQLLSHKKFGPRTAVRRRK